MSKASETSEASESSGDIGFFPGEGEGGESAEVLVTNQK